MSAPSGGSMTWQAAPFTVAQWQELEHQALIFKYLKAGLTVPPDLLVPIRRSLQLMSPKLSHSLHYPSLGYYGKKIDPEPGRCRRTDGKKWRCSRDAHPDSKYCDRHMIRRRYRSRKPVESSSSSSQQQQQQQQQQQPPPSSTSITSSQLATTAAAGSGSGGGSGGGGGASASGTFHTLPLHTNGTREGFTLGGSNNNSSGNHSLQHFQMDSLSLPGEVSKKEYRFSLTSEADEHNFLQKDLGNVRYQGYDFTSDGMWSMSQISSNTVSESRTGSTMVGDCFQQQTIRDADLLNLNAVRTKDLVFNGQLSSAGCLKQEYQSPQSLFSDWHWKKDLGSDAIEYRPNKDFNSDANVDCNGSL